jgi:hypothetical protein
MPGAAKPDRAHKLSMEICDLPMEGLASFGQLSTRGPLLRGNCIFGGMCILAGDLVGQPPFWAHFNDLVKEPHST